VIIAILHYLDCTYRLTLRRIVAYIRRKIEERRIAKAVRHWERLLEEVFGYEYD
jgi:hypothetical protein